MKDFPIRLVNNGLVTSAQLADAQAQQSIEGGEICRHLVLSGALTRRELFTALAERWQLPLVDLLAEPPDPQLVDLRHTDAARDGWIPWRREEGTTVIATSVQPTPALLESASRRLSTPVRAVITTDWDIVRAVETVHGEALAQRAAEQFATERPDLSAKPGLMWWQSLIAVVIVLGWITAFVVAPRPAVLVTFILANVMFSIQALFKVVTALRRFGAKDPANTDHDRIRDDDLPVYTILVPAFHESNVVEQVITNVGALDYPRSKLDVLLLLEADDVETIAAAKAAKPPEYVRIVIVPPGSPQTKPRACNYGLAFARGAYVVIFDAEDRPDPNQLRQAVAAFRADEIHREDDARPLACVQASLNYFNADYDVLTRLFAVEYAHWFDAMLPGMDAFKIAIPLGGTSNHFDLTALVQAGGWDPYNVTEDADLGMRIDAAGFRVATIDSVTWEEATARIRPWIRQRTRWIKGYMMTAAVSLRHPIGWFRTAGMRGAITMVGLIMGTPLAFLAYPFTLGLTLLTIFHLPSPLGELSHWMWVAGAVNFFIATGALIVVSAAAAWRRYSWRIAVFALLNPLYWVGHAVAAWRAAWQLLTSPHRWEKTPHGLTEQYGDSLVEMQVTA